MFRLTDSAAVVRLSDGAFIPADPANADRQFYEQWISGGGVPEGAAPDPPPAATEQIEALEREHMMPRATREFMLTFMETTAIQQGAGQGLTPEQSLTVLRAGNSGYRKVKELDEQIDALRAAQ
jgi:hypothetical protein